MLLFLVTFGALMAVLGGFLAIWSRGGPRIYGAGFLAVGIIVLVATAMAILGGAFLSGVDIIWDIFVPAIVSLLAVAVGAVLAIVPFLFAAIRT